MAEQFDHYAATRPGALADILRNRLDVTAADLAHFRNATAALRAGLTSAREAVNTPYDLGVVNGLELALSLLENTELAATLAPDVYRAELGYWGGRYRWYRLAGKRGRLASVFLASLGRGE